MANVLSYSLFTNFDVDLFKAGKHYRLFEKMGSHPVVVEGKKGVYFAVWAPTAKSVSVVGDFNHWVEGEHELFVRWDESGIWEGFIPGIEKGAKYKYKIHSHNNDIKTERPTHLLDFVSNLPKQHLSFGMTLINGWIKTGWPKDVIRMVWINLIPSTKYIWVHGKRRMVGNHYHMLKLQLNW